MGCECCKVVAPKDYNTCKLSYLQESNKPYNYIAPCGMDFSRGSKFTPKRIKKKRK